MVKAGAAFGFRNSTFFVFGSNTSVPLTPASTFFCPAGAAKYSAQANLSAGKDSVVNTVSEGESQGLEELEGGGMSKERRVAIITGAAQGIGRRTAELLA